MKSEDIIDVHLWCLYWRKMEETYAFVLDLNMLNESLKKKERKKNDWYS